MQLYLMSVLPARSSLEEAMRGELLPGSIFRDSLKHTRFQSDTLDSCSGFRMLLKSSLRLRERTTSQFSDLYGGFLSFKGQISKYHCCFVKHRMVRGQNTFSGQLLHPGLDLLSVSRIRTKHGVLCSIYLKHTPRELQVCCNLSRQI